MGQTERVKKSIYLDADLVEPLRERARFEHRSETAQINHVLRESLSIASVRVTNAHPALTPQPGGIRPFRGPDPKPSSRKSKKRT